MKITLRVLTVNAVLFGALIGCSTTKEVTVSRITPQEAQTFAAEAFIYGYPLVLSGVTRDVETAAAYTTKSKAPINQLLHKRTFPDERFMEVVTPNADTLYSTAWLDVSEGPIVLTLPSSNRYYLAPILSAWTEVIASPGTRSSGNDRREFVITGPKWKGPLPTDMQEIKSPTNNLWLIGRIQTNGKKDYLTVHNIQDNWELTPLRFYGKSYLPPSNVEINPNVDTSTPPVDQVAKMDAKAFFSHMAEEMKHNPPVAADVPMVVKLQAMGLTPGEAFVYENLSPAMQQALDDGYAAGVKRLQTSIPSNASVNNGWMSLRTVGIYGDKYLDRAYVAMTGLGANTREDAVYFRAVTDATGDKFNGKNKYVLRFKKGQIPPVNGFWSLSMYNSKRFFVKNPIDRFAIGDRDRLNFNSDGSLDIYVQSQSPGKAKEANWLPAPAEDFNLVMRLYWPKQVVLDGTWKAPAVERTSEPGRLSKNVEF
ncbi:DUF1254 domain-containing protein [Bdellovibrio svalbardensis]|uniref:DUF1254 domain-containing protein n=1 Tax=Bdellovibrio svalbardensis TaxID=2972972 RepID=A0ABT6DLQ7_9BACT|nr:DUF1254 domain-containing protein [Bdellovibrio svalbardensis]MDG0817814.1 DUF1254 domain-containing protein [Bdellovibrio svalbardensis]